MNLKGGGSVTAVRNACKGDPELPLNRDGGKARELLSFAAINDVDAVVMAYWTWQTGAVPGFSFLTTSVNAQIDPWV